MLNVQRTHLLISDVDYIFSFSLFLFFFILQTCLRFKIVESIGLLLKPSQFTFFLVIEPKIPNEAAQYSKFSI